MDFDLLVLDLDGTTLHGEGQLGEVDIEAAAALREAGVQITICTGRLFGGSQWVAERLGVTGGIALANGSEILDAQTGHALHADYLDRDVLAGTRRLMERRGVAPFLFRSRGIHYNHAHAHHAPYLGIWTPELNAHADVYALPDWDHADDVIAVCALGNDADVDALMGELHAEIPDDHGTFRFHTFDGDAFLKLRHHGRDKGDALELLAAERGTTAARTVAVGDWLNDLPMLRRAGRGYAMGHALDPVRDAADEVLDATRVEGGAIAEVARRVWGVEV